MKTVVKITLGLATAVVLFVGCGDGSVVPAKEAKKPVLTISEESLGLRKTDIYTENNNTISTQAHYSDKFAGSGHKIQRAFQDAPPMIPHDVEGMLPITINDNQCVGCHMPEVAANVGATSIPTSHFLDMRPHDHYDGKTFTKAVDNMKNETSIKSTNGKLAGARFNCTQCHAPQSQGQLVENNFEADYTSKDGASKSSWNGAKLMEGLDTVNGK